MGFFKRFFSLGSRKSKKSRKQAESAATVPVDSEGRIIRTQNHDSDADANRLLRSTSARFAVLADTDYAPPPPLRMLSLSSSAPILNPSTAPINHLAVPLSASPARSSMSLQRSNTYVVKVHSRTLHSCTEFPNANPRISSDEPSHDHHEPRTPSVHADRSRLKDVLFTPRDESRLCALRRDPSVASLLNMYDDKGCLDENAFSNTPPTPAPIKQEGREQIKRSGSTLRQLLGNPDEDGGPTEGDISWAERFLRYASDRL